jgi:hypothetical protein
MYWMQDVLDARCSGCKMYWMQDVPLAGCTFTTFSTRKMSTYIVSVLHGGGELLQEVPENGAVPIRTRWMLEAELLFSGQELSISGHNTTGDSIKCHK